MPSGRLLRQLIKSGAEGNVDSFKELSQQVIAEERQKQHHLLANDLERILYGQYRAGQLQVVPKGAPTDRESGVPLLSSRAPARGLSDVVLADETKSLLETILLEHNRSDVLTSYGLKAVNKLLFYGPPGCGKTLTAEVIACELDRLFVVLRLDAVVSSYLGETATNLRKVFDFVTAQPLVVLFDEFDAIGRERAAIDDHGELKRVVNAVLQMLDDYQGRSILIAATNHEATLDYAIWRRFDEIMFFGQPATQQIAEFLEAKLRGVRRQFEADDPALIRTLVGTTYADIERIVRRAIKEMVLANAEFLSKTSLLRAIKKEKQRRALLK